MRQLLAALEEARAADPHDPALPALASTINKLVLADSYIATLAVALDDATPPSDLAASLDLDLFRQATPHGAGLFFRQFRWRSPALRYAIRLSLAMATGLALTLIFPRFAHANWILLTIALIMRANYSVTRQRRWDRITGTLIGCALAVLFINTMPAAGAAGADRAGGGDQPCLWPGGLPHHRRRRLDLIPAAAAFCGPAGASAILRTHRGYADRRRAELGVQLSAAQLGAA